MDEQITPTTNSINTQTGIVYVLTNSAMPDIIKIGFTGGNVEKRMKELDTTSLPLPFECWCAYEVTNANNVEKIIHSIFDDYRLRQSREFFTVAPSKVDSLLKLLGGKDVLVKDDEPNEQGVMAVQTLQRREKLKFKNIGILKGSTLFFAKDNQITCTVIDSDNKVELFLRDGTTQGQMSLSQAAKKALESIKITYDSAQGGRFWLYSPTNDPLSAKDLVSIRNEVEQTQDDGAT